VRIPSVVVVCASLHGEICLSFLPCISFPELFCELVFGIYSENSRAMFVVSSVFQLYTPVFIRRRRNFINSLEIALQKNCPYHVGVCLRGYKVNYMYENLLQLVYGIKYTFSLHFNCIPGGVGCG
jgi:hypothetical protein